MRSGPITQFNTSEAESMVLEPLSPTIFPRSSYLTRARGGYIIQIRPRAMGIEVEPTLREFNSLERPGKA
jgi:hypothetical protein